MSFEDMKNNLIIWGKKHNFLIKDFEIITECGICEFEISFDTKLYDEIYLIIKNPKSFDDVLNRMNKIFNYEKGENNG